MAERNFQLFEKLGKKMQQQVMTLGLPEFKGSTNLSFISVLIKFYSREFRLA